MASSEKTANLGLNLWEPEDKPIRADFVADNQLIDQVVGTHTKNSNIHITASEKTKLNEPYQVKMFAGTGSASFTYTFDFSPKFVVVYKKNAPMFVYSGGASVINGALAASVYGATQGAQLNANKLTLTQQSASVNGVRCNLNEEDGQYVIVAYR